MPNDTTPLIIAPAHAASAKPVFKDQAEFEEFWQEFYSKVKLQLQALDAARAQSEESARNLWLQGRSQE